VKDKISFEVQRFEDVGERKEVKIFQVLSSCQLGLYLTSSWL
jgi:hypothetical protein